MIRSSVYSFFILLTLIQIMLFTSCGKKIPKTYTVGVLNIVPDLEKTLAGFKEGMKDVGYREGENIRYLYSGPTTDMSRLSEVARKLLEARVDLFFTITTPATLAAKEVTKNTSIPVVFAVVTDPVGAGIVKSLKRPEGRFTGVTFGMQEARRLEWLVRIAPKTRSIYIPYNINDKSPLLALKIVRKTAVKLGVKLITRKVYNRETLNHAVLNIPGNADSVFILPDSLLTTRLTDISAAAISRRLPTSSPNVSAVKSMQLLTSYGEDQYITGRQAARMVDLVFKGANPSEMPVETAEFFLAINLKVAKKIGLTIPDEILRHAHYIVR